MLSLREAARTLSALAAQLQATDGEIVAGYYRPPYTDQPETLRATLSRTDLELVRSFGVILQRSAAALDEVHQRYRQGDDRCVDLSQT